MSTKAQDDARSARLSAEYLRAERRLHRYRVRRTILGGYGTARLGTSGTP